MLQELPFWHRKHNLVGIYCPLLENGLFLVGVENISCGEVGFAVITLFPQDMSGHTLARRSIELCEIKLIVPFNNPYVSPVTPRAEYKSLAS